MIQSVGVALLVILNFFTEPSFAAEVITPEEKAYFQTWTQNQDHKFPRKRLSFTLENGLEVLLIQDPRAKKAAVAVDVGIGAANDPVEHTGLSHYLEHMLFVSTLKYPELNGFDKFTADHNGGSNAYTDTYHTNYHFDVNAGVLKEGLDRFSQFFISPTFDPSQLEKELEAVDAEYQKNAQQDVWGLNHILNSLGNPEHPKFRDFQGNKATLSGVTQSQIREFFETHYSSHLMRLVVIAPNDLSEVEGWVRAFFAGVKRNPIATPSRKKVLFFPSDRLPRLITYKGVESRQTLTLEFELPAFDDLKYSTPSIFLSELISSDRKGMLSDALIKKGWISHLSSHQEDLGTSQLLGVDFQLTDLGAAHWKDVIFDFYQAMALLRNSGLPRYAYDEIKLQGELQFTHSSPANDIDRASTIASHLQNWPSDEVECLEALTARYAPTTYGALLDLVRPNRMQVLLTDHHLSGGHSDPFYNVQYQESSLSAEDIARWTQAALNPELIFPAPNPYLPTDFSLRGTSDPSPILFEAPGTRIWVQTDHEFGIPRVELGINVLSAHPFTKRQQALRVLYAEAVSLASKAILGQASAFGYEFSIDPSKAGYYFRFGGFSDGFERFLAELTQKLNLSDLSVAEFQAIQEGVIHDIDDELTQEPYGIAHSRLKSLLAGALTYSDLRAELVSVTLAEVIAFAQGFWAGELLMHGAAFGNLVHADAQRYLGQFRTVVKNHSYLPKEAVALEKFVAFEKGSALVHKARVQDQNHGVSHYFSFGKTTPAKRVLLESLELLMANQFFKDLRTEGKIGYVARFGNHFNPGQCGIGVLVQSAWPVEKIDAACLGWLEGLPHRLTEVTAESFKQVKASLLDELQKPTFTFEEKAAKIFNAIFEHREQLDWKKDAIQLLEKLELADVVNFVGHKLDPVRRRLLSVYALGSPDSGSEHEDGSMLSEESSCDEGRESPLASDSRPQVTTEEFSTSCRKYLVPRFR